MLMPQITNQNNDIELLHLNTMLITPVTINTTTHTHLYSVHDRDVRKPNFGPVSVFKNLNQTKPKPKGQTRNFGFRGFSPNGTCLIQIVNI